MGWAEFQKLVVYLQGRLNKVRTVYLINIWLQFLHTKYIRYINAKTRDTRVEVR